MGEKLNSMNSKIEEKAFNASKSFNENHKLEKAMSK